MLPLFVPSSNNSTDSGEGRDRWVPAPLISGSETYATQLAGYYFLGQMMGLAVRSQNLLPLNFPSIVWKQLVNAPVSIEDLRGVDEHTFILLKDIKKEVDPEMFDECMDDTFFDVLPRGGTVTVPLVPGGSQRPLTFANREEYNSALLAYRLAEYTPQCLAIRSGLATVLPYACLSILSWKQLEMQVCGGTFDVDLLRQMTTYGTRFIRSFVLLLFLFCCRFFLHVVHVVVEDVVHVVAVFVNGDG